MKPPWLNVAKQEAISHICILLCTTMYTWVLKLPHWNACLNIHSDIHIMRHQHIIFLLWQELIRSFGGKMALLHDAIWLVMQLHYVIIFITWLLLIGWGHITEKHIFVYSHVWGWNFSIALIPVSPLFFKKIASSILIKWTYAGQARMTNSL